MKTLLVEFGMLLLDAEFGQPIQNAKFLLSQPLIDSQPNRWVLQSSRLGDQPRSLLSS